MTRFATMIVLVLLIGSFQNCSNAKFIQNVTGLSGKGMGPAAVVGLGSNGASQPGITVPATPGGVTDHTAVAAVSECNALLAKAAALEMIPANASIVSRRGNRDFQSIAVDLFEGNSGNFGILGLATSSRVNSVLNSSGNLLICGMDVLQIRNANGNILVVGGDVGDVVGFSGNIKIVNGRVLGSQTGVTGTVIEVVYP